MKLFLFYVVFVFSFGCVHTIGKAQNLGKDFKLVWSDEFTNDGLPDSTKWNYDIGGHGWGNKELQFYTEKECKNARIENGKLIIEAHKEPIWGLDFTSARLITKEKGGWKYGKIVIRAKLPRGNGTWPAIWMLPCDNEEYGPWPESGEIDIMEHVGHNQGYVHGAIHTSAYNHMKKSHQSDSIYISNTSDNFHVYSIEWTSNKIEFFIDNNRFFLFKKEANDFNVWPFDKPFYLILNIAVGGNWGNLKGIDDSIWPQKMEVDYVRVYQE